VKGRVSMVTLLCCLHFTSGCLQVVPSTDGSGGCGLPDMPCLVHLMQYPTGLACLLM
jgi:hypothetical protein